MQQKFQLLLRERRAQTSEFERENESVCAWVFNRNGHQVSWYYDGWRTACEKAGVPGRLLHDLRRSAVRNLVRAGASEQVAMSITGHKTRSVFDRYHIVSNDQVEAVKKLAALHGAIAPEPRKVVAIGEASARGRRGTVRGQLRDNKPAKRPQLPATQWRKVASPTGFEAKDRVKPPSEPDDQTRKDNELRKESDDGNRQE